MFQTRLEHLQAKISIFESSYYALCDLANDEHIQNSWNL